MKNKINCHIYREANMVADALVNLFGHKSERIITFGFVTLLPPVFCKKICMMFGILGFFKEPLCNFILVLRKKKLCQFV